MTFQFTALASTKDDAKTESHAEFYKIANGDDTLARFRDAAVIAVVGAIDELADSPRQDIAITVVGDATPSRAFVNINVEYVNREISKAPQPPRKGK